jgi:hypothetical protein
MAPETDTSSPVRGVAGEGSSTRRTRSSPAVPPPTSAAKRRWPPSITKDRYLPRTNWLTAFGEGCSSRATRPSSENRPRTSATMAVDPADRDGTRLVNRPQEPRVRDGVDLLVADYGFRSRTAFTE